MTLDKKIKSETVTFTAHPDFIQSLIEMVKGGDCFTDVQDLREYILDCMYEDAQKMAEEIYLELEKNG